MIHIQEWFKLPVPDSAQKINSKWTKGFINVRLLKHLEKKSGEDTAGGKCTPMCLHILPMSKVKEGQGQGTVTASSMALFKPETGMFAEAGHCLRTDLNKRLPSASLPRMQSHKQPCWDPWLGLAGCHLAFPTLSIWVALSLHLSTQPICSQLHFCFEFVFLNLLYLPIRLSDSALWSLAKHFKI